MKKKPLNVLLLGGRFEVRGSSVQSLNLAERLPALDVKPRILCAEASTIDSQRKQKLDIWEAPVIHLPGVGRWIMRWWLDALADEPPDVIHIQSRHVLALGTRLARWLNRPFLVTVHDYLSPRETFRFDTGLGRAVIAVSESVREELLSRTGLPDELVKVIYSGVAPGVIMSGPAVLEPGHVPVVGTAGPLEASKGLRYFLEAVPHVLAAFDDVEFLIAGAGPEEKVLRQIARDRKIDRKVTFVPRLYDIADAIAALDIFCLPSLKQGLGTMMLEAMVRGKPVIATKAGGVYSVVTDGETGLLVPPSDSEALARAIVDLLNDPLRARTIGRAAQQTVLEDFGVDKMVRQTAALYHEIAQQDKARRSATAA